MKQQELGPYTLLDELGAGGMGRVYRAHHRELDRIVALKTLRDDFSTEFDGMRRFLREVKLSCSLSHPNLIQVLDGGVIKGQAYLAMELVEGTALQEMIGLGATVPWPRAAAITAGVASALAVLHAADIIHRDIKPSNILVTTAGVPKLIDFGLARKVDSTHYTAEGNMAGTLLYLAPEVIVGGPAAAAADYWALGCTLYYLLTGELPFSNEQPVKLMEAIVKGPIPDPRSKVPALPLRLSRITLELLSRDPSARTANVPTLVERLEGLNAEEPHVSGATPTVKLSRSIRVSTVKPPPRRRSPLLWALPVAAVLLFFGLRGFRPSRSPAPHASTAVPSAAAPAAVGRTFDGWRRLEPLLPLLTQRKLDPAMRERLHRATGLDLGRDAAVWSHWARLGRWLVDPDRPPAPPRSALAQPGNLGNAGRGQNGDFTRIIAERELHQLVGIDYPGQRDLQLSGLLSFTAQWPDEPRAWLCFGRFLEEQGALDLAKCLYRLGLALLEPSLLAGYPPGIWSALLRALIADPARDLNREWVAAVREVPAHDAIQDAIVRTIPEFLVEQRLGMLRLTASVPQHRANSMAYIGRYLATTRRATLAMELWLASARTDAKVDRVLDNLFRWSASSGDLAIAAAVSKLPSQFQGYQTQALAYMQAAPGAVANLIPIPDEQVEVFRLVEGGRHRDALALARKFVRTQQQLGVIPWVIPVLHILSAGIRDPELESIGEQVLFVSGPQPAELQSAAAGALSAPVAQPIMEQWLARAASRPAVPGLAVDALKALWLSRCGRLLESIQILEDSHKKGLTALDPDLRMEVLARPYWWALSGRTVEPEVLRRAQAAQVPLSAEAVGYWAALQASERPRAARIARRWRLDMPMSHPWMLADLYGHLWTRSKAELIPYLAGARAACRSQMVGLWFLEELLRLATVPVTEGSVQK